MSVGCEFVAVAGTMARVAKEFLSKLNKPDKNGTYVSTIGHLYCAVMVSPDEIKIAL